MWIGFAIVMMINGSVVSGAAMFDTEQECRAQNEKIIADAKAHPGVSKYHLECVKADTFLRDK